MVALNMHACSLSAAQDIQAQLAQFKESLSIPQAEYDSLASIQTEMTGLGATSIPYSTHSWDSIVAKWEQLQALLPKRDEQLGAEVVKQQSHEMLRKDWAAHAAKVQEWVAAQNAAIQAVILNTDNQKMDDQLAALKAIEARECVAQSVSYLAGDHQRQQAPVRCAGGHQPPDSRRAHPGQPALAAVHRGSFQSPHQSQRPCAARTSAA